MKSYCIKTQNDEIITYLLNRISEIDFPNIYYCNRTFKIYDNLIMHYKEKNIEQFENIVSSLIIDTIGKFYQEKILKRIINVNYFYFDEYEREIILEECDELLQEEEINKIIFPEVKKIIIENRNIFIEGIVNFRIPEYIKFLDSIVDVAVNKYIIEKEYKEFISLLKLYVNTTESKTDIIHLIYIHGESILLDREKNLIQNDSDINNSKYLSDISFSSNDIALNTLLSMLPKNVEIHLLDKEDEFISTLKLIFENKVKICTDCNICRVYKKQNPFLKIGQLKK